VGKISFDITRCRWEDDIKIDLKVVGWEGVGWIPLAEDKDKRRPLVNTVINSWLP
jgi:hypothetical protein